MSLGKCVSGTGMRNLRILFSTMEHFGLRHVVGSTAGFCERRHILLTGFCKRTQSGQVTRGVGGGTETQTPEATRVI